ncbi:Calcineurin-like protein phosphoesterase [Dinothrombium tinctorium]|uniref:Serine/threonine-protein phosphatase n=1 Tax=Dinothrombium tinctorium TaxID=1965070 RepID=A0A443QYY0_9ACAR|nr:Calcineurin-like protein phosphoesterase [Dinothrombium tinctorium]
MSRKAGKDRGLPSRSPSLESTASQTSAPVVKVGRKASTETLIGQGTVAYGQFLYDCCALLVFCPKHNNFALTKIGSRKGVWLPHVPVKTTEGWFTVTAAKLKAILTVAGGAKSYLSFSPPEMIHLFRIQLPSIARFATRVTYFTQLTHDTKYPTNCCQSNKTVSWFSAQDVMSHNVPELWGPEPYVFCEAFLNNNIDKGAYTEYTLRDAMKYTARDPPKTYQDEMLKSANFTERDIAKIYGEFIQHCYPSHFMVFNSFADYMKKIGWGSNDLDLPSTYRAFAFNKTAYITFHEFLLGLAALDKHTHQGGHTGELRCGYIFRYYDLNSDGVLDHSEMIRLVTDILRLHNKPVDDESVEKEVEKNYAALGIQKSDNINLELFTKGVGTLVFRGSSKLFRFSSPILQAINLKKCYDSISQLHLADGIDDGPGKRPKGTCPRCRTKKYTLAMYAVRISPEGFPAESVEINQDDVQNMSKEKKFYELLQFRSDHMCHQIMEMIRDQAVVACGLKPRYTQKSKNKQQLALWSIADREKLAIIILKILQEAENIFKKESRVVKLNSPAYVLGDIHGNLHDLILYERTLWDKGPACAAASYLFLGDYVDRGDFGLECVLYLLAAKILNPEKFFMLRGNHELRAIQMVFTFHKECVEKFGKSFGPTIWENCNKIFDCMPLCAILYSIPVPLNDPENGSPPAWEMLWNDPVSGNEFGEYAEMLRLQSGSNAFNNLQGFLPNTKRGTAYYFSEEAVSKFLNSNGLSHVIRAHEVIPPGYQFHMGGKVITVFSSSRYCGGNNEAACIFIEQEKIRVLVLDTIEKA